MAQETIGSIRDVLRNIGIAVAEIAETSELPTIAMPVVSNVWIHSDSGQSSRTMSVSYRPVLYPLLWLSSPMHRAPAVSTLLERLRSSLVEHETFVQRLRASPPTVPGTAIYAATDVEVTSDDLWYRFVAPLCARATYLASELARKSVV